MLREFTNVFKKSRFAYLWISQVLSQLTVNVMNFLLLTHVYNVTQSSIATSLLWVAYSLPALIIGPIGAASVDLVDKRKMLMTANFLQALTVFIYLFTNQRSIFILYIVVLGYSTFNQFYAPAESASLPSVVPKSFLARANSIFFMTSQASLILGFGFAGLIQRTVGFNGALILCTIFLFLAFVSVSFLPSNKPSKKISGEFETLLKTFFDTILEGYEFIRNNKAVLFPLLILLAVQGGLAVIVVSLPLIATQILGVQANLAGVFIVVPAGIGALVGSVIIPRLIRKEWRKKAVIEVSLGFVTLSLVMLGIGINLLPVTLRVVVTFMMIILAGLAFVGINIPSVTFLQEWTPSHLRGRVFGNLWFMVTIITIIPVLFSGAVSEIFGIRTLLVILACGTFLMLFYSIRKGQKIIESEFEKLNG